MQQPACSTPQQQGCSLLSTPAPSAAATHAGSLTLPSRFVLFDLLPGKCPTPQWALSDFIDPATPAEFCTKAVCVGPYSQCCGASPNSCNATSSTEQLVSSNYPTPLRGQGVRLQPRNSSRVRVVTCYTTPDASREGLGCCAQLPAYTPARMQEPKC